MPLLEGKVALVTGSGSRIGQAACHLYTQHGGKVVSDVDERPGDETECRLVEFAPVPAISKRTALFQQTTFRYDGKVR